MAKSIIYENNHPNGFVFSHVPIEKLDSIMLI